MCSVYDRRVFVVVISFHHDVSVESERFSIQTISYTGGGGDGK